jgi:hypothetical protein
MTKSAAVTKSVSVSDAITSLKSQHALLRASLEDDLAQLEGDEREESPQYERLQEAAEAIDSVDLEEMLTDLGDAMAAIDTTGLERMGALTVTYDSDAEKPTSRDGKCLAFSSLARAVCGALDEKLSAWDEEHTGEEDEDEPDALDAVRDCLDTLEEYLDELDDVDCS